MNRLLTEEENLKQQLLLADKNYLELKTTFDERIDEERAKTLKAVGTQMYESLPSGHVSGFELMKWAKKWIETLQRGIMPGEEK